MNMRQKVIMLILGSAILGGIFFLDMLTSNNQGDESIRSAVNSRKRQPAPLLSLKNYRGQTVNLVDFKGKPLVLNSWATWCPFCVQELVDFAKLQQEFGEQVVIVAINRAESRNNAENFTDKLGINDKLMILLDPSDAFYQAIGGFSMPETIFVNREGEIVFHKRGPMKEDELRTRLKNMLNMF